MKHLLTTGAEGFTLVEVLVAMVILAVGLLALQGLSIGAARSITLAGRQSEYATIARDSLESALHTLRQGALPGQFCREDFPLGDRLSRLVDVSNPRLARVVVRAIPDASSPNAPRHDFRLESSLYVPFGAAGVPAGLPCE